MGSRSAGDSDRAFTYVKNSFKKKAALSIEEIKKRKGKELRAITLDGHTEVQSETCKNLAVKFCEEVQGVELKNAKATRSNYFDREALGAGETSMVFHATFKAGEERRRIYFVELVGKDGPEQVTLCCELRDRGTTENCAMCTGIRHPLEGNFIGFHQPD